MKINLLVAIVFWTIATIQSAYAKVIPPLLPKSILNMPATKAIKLPGIDRLVFVDEPIYPGSNFTWKEATKGGSRIPVDTMFDGRLYSAAEIVQNIIDFARDLDDIRAQFGNRPITLSSWYRTPAANRAARGRPKSLHLIGMAGDIRISGISPPKVYARLAPTWLGGLGNNTAYTHIDKRDRLGWTSGRWVY
ncbi:D-Ala-D-Ala carboxypeptidase family metallohydrolase [Chamaesiphon minutus]|nr:D-Ala-D-Ala carboxypeptidase family metallohydrolase [Chamaesiphon minutus]